MATCIPTSAFLDEFREGFYGPLRCENKASIFALRTRAYLSIPQKLSDNLHAIVEELML